jgi:hypothetical protein
MNRVACWMDPATGVEMAFFLQQHGDPETGEIPLDRADVRIAYRTFHPTPIEFTRSVRARGGSLEDYDPGQVLELPSGRTEGKPYRDSVLPEAVSLKRNGDGALVDAHVDFVATIHIGEMRDPAFTVEFRSDDKPSCPCCPDAD